MNNNLSMIPENGQLILRLPYAMKDAFRAIFKTAEWSSGQKAFIVKDTTQNRNKWTKFVEATQDAKAALDEQDRSEATLQQLTEMSQKLAEVISNARAATAKSQAQIDALKSTLAELKPQAEAATAALQTVQAQAAQKEAEFRQVMAPAIEVIEQVKPVLENMLRAARKGYSGKAWLGDLLQEAIAIHRQLRAVGFRHPLLVEVCNLSLNRPDKFIDTVPRVQAKLLTGLEALTED